MRRLFLIDFFSLLFFKWFRSLALSFNNVRGTYEALKTLNPMRLLRLSYNFSVNNSNFLLHFFDFVAPHRDCNNYKKLRDANRKSSYKNRAKLCDDKLHVGWYRFVGAAGTKMPTSLVPSYRCGTVYSGWLNGSHPSVEDGEVDRRVCFSDYRNHCRGTTKIGVRNCGSYYIYKLRQPSLCAMRYCGTDWLWSKCTSRKRRIQK